MSKHVEITLLSKPGCHLCDEARQVVELTREKLETRIRTELEEINILEHPELARMHAEDIPVVLIDGRQHAIWRVDPARLERAIEKAVKPGLFGRIRSKETT